jgi:hypothetical protein
MEISRDELVRILRTEGDNDTADKAGALPDRVDTDRDAALLEGIGLDRTQLMAKLAAAGFGGSIAP